MINRALVLVVAAACFALASCESTKPAEMSPEDMMAKMQELGTPGAGHQRLQALVGTWSADGEFWMDPAAPPEKTAGTATNAWCLDGRFLRSDFQGTMMGQPFQGLGMTGFNNATQQYEATWVDSMVTYMMPVSIGTVDESGKVITFSRDFHDPIMGTRSKTREVMTINDNDHHTFEWYQPGADGKEMLMFRIEYTRK